ncbi:MAG: restriction endonuclease subunit S [Desulfobulbaceae bacterium]
MNLETFFEKFELFADMPGAVEKMRELVRTLAVQGKIVSQNPDDEPANVLIRRVSAGLPRNKSENPFIAAIEPSITDESKYELPSGWAWLPLGHVGIWASGCGFPKHFQGEKQGEFPFCKVSDMNLPGNEVEIQSTVNSINNEVMKKIRARANPVGTVIFPKIGGAIATHKRRLVIKPTIIDNNCSGIQPIGITDNKWLLLLMRSIDLSRYQSGTSVPAVSQGSLDPIRIGLPPLAEQKRIVAKVDELMALCDRLEAQQKERVTGHAALSRASLARFADAPTPSNLQFLFHKSYDITPADLRKSILTLAVQGKLVPQDPNDEPAEELLSQILANNPRLRDSFKEPAEQTINGEALPIIPKSWVPVALGRVMKVTSSKRIFESEYADTGVPFFRSKEIGDLSRGESIKTTLYISQERYAELRQYPDYPKPGDLLLTSVGTIGNTWIVDDREFYFKDGNITQIIQTDGIEMRYVQLYIASPMFTDAVERIVAGTAYKALTIIKIKALTFPLPPLAEQRRIVAKVDELMSLVDALETQLTTARSIGKNLLEAVIAELTQ